jgi:hypothetical protein
MGPAPHGSSLMFIRVHWCPSVVVVSLIRVYPCLSVVKDFPVEGHGQMNAGFEDEDEDEDDWGAAPPLCTATVEIVRRLG